MRLERVYNGGLMEELALAYALNQSWIAGTGLDVLSMEPPPIDSPLLNAENCIITPHMAWATQIARIRLLQVAAQKHPRLAEQQTAIRNCREN